MSKAKYPDKTPSPCAAASISLRALLHGWGRAAPSPFGFVSSAENGHPLTPPARARRALRPLLASGALALTSAALLLAAPGAQALNFEPGVKIDSTARPFPEAFEIALDQSTEELYVAVRTAPGGGPGYVAKFDASGNPGTPATIEPNLGAVWGIALNPANESELFVHAGESVDAFNTASGALLGTRFSAPAYSNVIAADPAGNFYIPSRNSVDKFLPSGPLRTLNGPDQTFTPATGTETLSAHVELGPGAKEIETCRFEYVEEAEYNPSAPNPYSAGAVAPCSPPTPITAPTEVSAEIAGLTPGTVYHYRLHTVETTPATPPTFSDSFAITNSVAVDRSNGDVYVADRGNEPNEDGKVVEFDSAGNPIATICNPCQAFAVAVDSANHDVFVAARRNGKDEGEPVEVTPYNSQGEQIGPGVVSPSYEEGQIAVDESSGDLYVAVASVNELYIWKYVPIPFPTATTGAASSITTTTANLAATVNPEGEVSTDCHFEYTTEKAFKEKGFKEASKATCSPDPGSASTDTAVSASVKGLSANTTYDFRVVQVTDGGEALGEAETFTTLHNPPTVTTGAASAQTATTATIAGTVNPNGGPVSNCRFEYGTTTAYGTSVPCPAPAGSGTAPVAESVGLTALAPTTTYHYRLNATNDGGSAEGADQTFTTLAPPEEPPHETEKPKPFKCRKGTKKIKVHGKTVCKKVKKKHRKHH